jgi:hypothetical protein
MGPITEVLQFLQALSLLVDQERDAAGDDHITQSAVLHPTSSCLPSQHQLHKGDVKSHPVVMHPIGQHAPEWCAVQRLLVPFLFIRQYVMD